MQRAAVAEVGVVVDGADLGVLRREAVGDLAGAIAAAVVDDDDFEISGEPASRLQRREGGGLDVGLFVVAGEEDGQAQRLARRSLWRGHAGMVFDGCRCS